MSTDTFAGADYGTRPLIRCLGCGQRRWTYALTAFASPARAWRCVPCGKPAAG